MQRATPQCEMYVHPLELFEKAAWMRALLHQLSAGV